MIDPIKLKIARRAQEMGFRFDESEIIDIVYGDHRIVFLRSIKTTRQVELSDGTMTIEEFNDPIIWLEYPSPMLTRCEPDYDSRVLNYSVHLPQLRILCPYLVHATPLVAQAFSVSVDHL